MLEKNLTREGEHQNGEAEDDCNRIRVRPERQVPPWGRCATRSNFASGVDKNAHGKVSNGRDACVAASQLNQGSNWS
jgi:hypothetical protein